jgi:hypothetical protein
MNKETTFNLPFFGLKSGCSYSRFQKWLCLPALFFFLGLPKIHAQQVMDYAIQANIIYRFTKYIDWPESKKTGDFIIGIVGDTPLSDELKNFIANKMAGTQKIVIKKISSSAESYSCNILFISEDESNNLRKIAAKTAGSAILLVTESDGLARRGSCINFVLAGDHLKLEINKKNIEQRDLSIASELLNLGIIVK